MSTVMAIDPSLTGFTIAVGRKGALVELAEYGSAPAKGVSARLKRYNKLIAHATTAVVNHRVTDVFIEGYAMSAKGRAVYDLGELGGILRHQLADRSLLTAVEVSPSALKKFCTGKGNAGKIAVASALTKRYGETFLSDNEADAFGLLQLGMCVVGQTEPQTKQQREVVEGLR